MQHVIFAAVSFYIFTIEPSLPYEASLGVGVLVGVTPTPLASAAFEATVLPPDEYLAAVDAGTYPAAVIECRDFHHAVGEDLTVEEYLYMRDLLINSRSRLLFLHIFCVFAILYTQVAFAFNAKAYVPSVLMMATVPVYNIVIYYCYFDVQEQDNISEVIECTGLSF